uniref:Uncharacterized protein n=1 Tax=candidate division WOR-3 bacterium TaxID=2052148 RepID=A0A7C3YUP5_UNCW3
MSATPSVVNLYRCLTAKNQGRKTIKIYRMSVWEECIGGWREGGFGMEMYWPVGLGREGRFRYHFLPHPESEWRIIF